MPCHAEIETSQAVTRQAVSSTLQHYSLRAVVLHDIFDHRFKDRFIGFVVNSIAQWEVNRIVLALAHTNISELAGAREVLAIFVEGDSHNSIGSVKGFFNPVSMVNVDIYVKYALVVSEKLENTKHDICSDC